MELPGVLCSPGGYHQGERKTNNKGPGEQTAEWQQALVLPPVRGQEIQTELEDPSVYLGKWWINGVM